MSSFSLGRVDLDDLHEPASEIKKLEGGFMSSLVSRMTEDNADKIAACYRDLLNRSVKVGFSQESESILDRVLPAWSALNRFSKHLSHAFNEVPDYFVNNFLRALFTKWSNLELELGDIDENTGEFLSNKTTGDCNEFIKNWLSGITTFSNFLSALEGVWRLDLEKNGPEEIGEISSNLSVLIPLFNAFSSLIEEEFEELARMLDQVPKNELIITLPGVQFASLTAIIDPDGKVRTINEVDIHTRDTLNPHKATTVPPANSTIIDTIELTRGEHKERGQRLARELERDARRAEQRQRITSMAYMMKQSYIQNARSTQEIPVDDINERLEQEKAHYINRTPTLLGVGMFACTEEGNIDPQVSYPIVKARIVSAVGSEIDRQSAVITKLQELLDDFMACHEEQECRDLLRNMEDCFGPEVLDFLRAQKRKFGARPYIAKEENDQDNCEDSDGRYVERVDIEANIPTDKIYYS